LLLVSETGAGCGFTSGAVVYKQCSRTEYGVERKSPKKNAESLRLI
jgi:hypothetical protein